jgi:predicted nucleic acid-binding protein
VTFVVDASVAVTWCFGDEATSQTDRLLERVRVTGAVAPAIWRLEVANVLIGAQRRGRMSASELDDALGALMALPIVIDHEASGVAWTDVARLARNELLTSYDATYLEVALREGIPLATLDNDLRRAALRCGVALLP